MAGKDKTPIDGADNSIDALQTITPAPLQLSQAPATAQSAEKNTANSKAFVLGSVFSLLLCAVLAVVFLLPRLVGERSAAPVEAAAPASQRPGGAEVQRSPWQEAQLARKRKEAQAVLEQLLERQFELEERSVRAWAGVQFQSAMQLAQEGDDLYRARDFDAATLAYRRGLEALDELLGSTAAVVEQQLQQGNAALAAGDAGLAAEKFELVKRIDPDKDDAQQGLQRAAVLNDVLDLMATATDLESQQQYGPAADKFQQALALDAQFNAAQQGLQRVRSRIKDDEFAELMSRGYQALGAEKHSSAIKAFQQALKVKAAAPEAEEALSQARLQLSLSKINTHLQTAKALEQQEKWSGAVAEYQAALKVDKNLVAVQERLRRAQTRARLDTAMRRAIAQPERLASDAVLQAARTLQRKAQSIERPGPLLTQQLETLTRQLRESQIPIPVQLESDNQTDVTVLKVKRLGRFSRQQLSLKPGSYVAVGSREKYRDVRVEFVLKPGMEAQNVVVKSVEKI